VVTILSLRSTNNKAVLLASTTIAITMKLEIEHAIHVLTTLKNLGLKSLEQFNLLCQCLSPLAKAIMIGRVKSLEELKKLLKVFDPLQIVEPVQAGMEMSVDEFITQSSVLATIGGKQIIGDKAYDFYKNEENWWLLPDNPGVQHIIFCGSQYKLLGDDGLQVRILSRFNHGWRENNSHWLKGRLSDCCVAAVWDSVIPVSH
jgi:hypothetical protein